MKRYNPKEIEPRLQQQWDEQGISLAVDFDAQRPKYVMLTEFPYPSGDGLHLGHVREYTLGDIIARYKRMHGYNVLYPMGYDAFGLPTENYAIKHGIAPQDATDRNVANFQKQFNSLGFSIDWTRSFRTSDPEYYKWTQWLFLQFYKHGLAYQDTISLNWCPKCKTGLANEEVANGRHERCDTLVEKRQLKQWMLRITQYADRLIEGLQELDFPSRIADQQINWIGRSSGAEITWEVCDREGHEENQQIVTFTTRKDTIPGVTFIVVAPESPLLDALTADDHKARVHSYRQDAQRLSDIERQEGKTKTGVFTGKYAKNPFNGQAVPIYAANYVLAGYGTGVVMGMGGHDLRDREFALQHDIPMCFTTEVPAGYEDIQDPTKVWKGDGLQVNSGAPYDGLPNKEAGQRIFEKLVAEGTATEKVNYKIRDWIFSRQHYWGEPIPIIHCPEHDAVAVPADQLPVTLPAVDRYEPTDTGESPLSEIDDWVNTTCPTCGGPAKRETDTMPNWAGSSWYYLRYFDAHNDQAFADPQKLAYWGQVDLYLGGMEHTTLHLLYSRFWHEFFYDHGLVPFPEPYHARRGQGIILAADGSKMSKSKGNVINPNDILEQGYGADAIRLAIAFLAPYDQTTPWSPEGVAGTFRFLQRVWTLTQGFVDRGPDAAASDDIDLRRIMHRTIQRVTRDQEQMGFNTAVSALMEAVNELYKLKTALSFEQAPAAWEWAIMTLLQLLAPFAPHITEELWQQLGKAGSIHTSTWPTYDEQYLVSDTMTIVVQINGKVREQLQLPADATQEAVLAAARASQKVQTHLADAEPKKSIYVPKKLVNFVI
jgi:leucyl-tRNA synthetase